MFTGLGALLMLVSTYYIGREATKLEVEYRCKTFNEAPLASSKIICNVDEDLPWAKELRKKNNKED